MNRLSNDYGIFSWFGYELPIAERLRLIKKAGFFCTSVWFGQEEEFIRNGKEELIPKLVRDSGLFLENVHAPFRNCNDIWSDNTSIRKAIQHKYISYVCFCSKHDIPILVIHISKSNDAPEFNKYGIRLLREIVRYAEDSNVIVAIENTRKPHYLDYIYSNIESPCLGFCYDSSHDFLYSDKPGMLLNKWGHLLVATHLSDNDGITDKHCLPKEGNIDWELVKKYFPGKTYSGNFILEVVSIIDQRKSADLFLKNAFERILWLKSLLMVF